MTALVTVTLGCDGPGCGAMYAPHPAADSKRAAREQAAALGWDYTGRDAGQDRCPRCAAIAAGTVPPPSLFDANGADWTMRLERLRVDLAPADLEGYHPAAATFSPDYRYRYALTRIWDRSKPLVCWIMLNPSTADAFALDPTLRRCQEFSRRWLAGGMLVLNMFGLRSTDPRGLVDHPDPVGPDNDLVIAHHFSPDAPHVISRGVMLGWGPTDKLGAGRRKLMAERAGHLVRLLKAHGRRPRALKVTADGSPGHPLYVPYDAVAVDYVPPAVGA